MPRCYKTQEGGFRDAKMTKTGAGGIVAVGEARRAVPAMQRSAPVTCVVTRAKVLQPRCLRTCRARSGVAHRAAYTSFGRAHTLRAGRGDESESGRKGRGGGPPHARSVRLLVLRSSAADQLWRRGAPTATHAVRKIRTPRLRARMIAAPLHPADARRRTRGVRPPFVVVGAGPRRRTLDEMSDLLYAPSAARS